jgi:hypothetical protein
MDGRDFLFCHHTHKTLGLSCAQESGLSVRSTPANAHVKNVKSDTSHFTSFINAEKENMEGEEK